MFAALATLRPSREAVIMKLLCAPASHALVPPTEASAVSCRSKLGVLDLASGGNCAHKGLKIHFDSAKHISRYVPNISLPRQEERQYRRKGCQVPQRRIACCSDGEYFVYPS